jgi:hypothetical protein
MPQQSVSDWQAQQDSALLFANPRGLWVCSGHVKVDGSAIFLLRDEASEYSGIKVDRSGSVVTEVPR